MGRYITKKERHQIEILLKQKYTIRAVADALGHKYNTVYKEIKRGTVKQLDSLLAVYYVYKSDYAQLMYERSISNRGRNLKIGSDYKLAAYIEDMVHNKHYSPEALLLHARNAGLQFDTTLCYKTIYNYFEKDLFLNAAMKDLPTKRTVCKNKKKDEDETVKKCNWRSIDERPADILERKEYGHWEMDTVVGGQAKGKSCLLVLSERMTREEIIVRMKDRKACSVVHALNMLEKRFGSRKFREKFKTITTDNGVEFSDNTGIEKSRYTKGRRTTLYKCHPYSSYERGTNENINRMIRRFFPKGINFDTVTQKQVAMVEDWINSYPRKILGGISSGQYIQLLDLSVI